MPRAATYLFKARVAAAKLTRGRTYLVTADGVAADGRRRALTIRSRPDVASARMPRMSGQQEQLFVVDRPAGAEWVPGKGAREQPLWDEHAAFMDDLFERGLIALGGPFLDGPARWS